MDIKVDAAKSKQLQDILFDLAGSQEFMRDSQACAEINRRLEEVYYIPGSKENYRHLYSDIFSALISIQNDPQKGDINILTQNLGLIRKTYQPEKTYHDKTLIDVSDSIRKLHDHVSLDVARLTYSDVHRDVSDLRVQVSKVEGEIKQARGEQEALRKRAADFEEKLADTQKEYISILGIFSAVVLAFVGGSMFSTSVLESIANTNIYRVVFITDFLAFVVVSLVYLLVTFIMKIVKVPTFEQISPVERVKRKPPKNRNALKNKIRYFFPLKTIYMVCLIIALLDVIAWAINLGQLVDFMAGWFPWIN